MKSRANEFRPERKPDYMAAEFGVNLLTENSALSYLSKPPLRGSSPAAAC
jgi:hypothetical protein